ncbi:MAG: 8-oxo-dGTP diphosphatase [Frankiaceae bacterium]|nr:8-oxo-dGTP diphosphatase [Frankiaceae bacterium]
MRGSGDGWVRCAAGHRHWGRYGAAGLLLRHRPVADAPLVLLQHRALWSHHGGTWGLPGGARDRDETAVAAALRETSEETTLDIGVLRVLHSYADEHGGWSYTTVVAEIDDLSRVDTRGAEGLSMRWVPEHEVPDLPLHPGFAATWPTLSEAPIPAPPADQSHRDGLRRG